MTPVDALHIESLHCELSNQTVLDGVSFRIPRGEYVSLLGPNGAGKSTLLRCILGQTACRASRIDVLNRARKDYPAKELGRAIAHVPQQLEYPVDFTVREFAMLSRYPHLSPFSRPTAVDRDIVEQALIEAGIEDFANRSLRRLSGGERRLACIAAALAQGAEILLLDEPLAHLDYRYRVRVQTLLQRLHDNDERTLLIVTHDVDAGVFSGDRAIALRQGHLVFDAPPADLLKGNALERIYDTPFERIDDPAGRPIVLPRSAAP